jgi:MtN3 and saliva related transmembrane protein
MAAPLVSPAVRALGYLAALLTTLSFFPQAIKTLRSGNTSGISLRMYGLFTAGIALWAVYGVCTRDGPLVTLVPAGIVLERKLRSLGS